LISFPDADVKHLLMQRNNLLAFVRRTLKHFICMLELSGTPAPKKRISRNRDSEVSELAEVFTQMRTSNKVNDENQEDASYENTVATEDVSNENSTVAKSTVSMTLETDIVALDSLRYSVVSDFTEVDFGMKDCLHAIRVLCDYFPDMNNGGVVFRFKANEDKILFKLFDKTVDDSAFIALDEC